MLKRILAAIAMSIGVATMVAAPSHAMSISSAARSISASMPMRDVAFSERTNLSNQLFCLQYGPQYQSSGNCQTGTDETGTDVGTSSRSIVAYTSKLRTVLASVNRAVNRIMPEIRARREFLSLSPLPGAGDAYAMTKRSHLMRAGLPAGAMRIASVAARDGRNHSVLIITTSTGELVLDHHFASVLKRRDSGYIFASMNTGRFID